MKTALAALGLALTTWITALVILVEPASASAYQPIRSARSRPIERVTFATHFTQDELYKAFNSGYMEAKSSADEAARRSEELAARFAGTVELTLTDGGGMSSYALDTGSAFAGCTVYRMDGVHFIVGDESDAPVGVYRWGLAGNVLKLDVVTDPDPARVVMLTLHPWVRVFVV